MRIYLQPQNEIIELPFDFTQAVLCASIPSVGNEGFSEDNLFGDLN